MPRKKRIWYPGAIYHIMSRGNRKTAIFKDGYDYYRFLKHLEKTKERYPFILHALCLMTNHFHLEMETEKISPGMIMQFLLSSYAEDFNERHDLTGHVFEGRFTSCLIEDEKYFLGVNRYIHLNPVKAFLVKNPGDYPYSSYTVYTRDIPIDRRNTVQELLYELVDTSRVMEWFLEPKAKNKYCYFVEGDKTQEEMEKQIQYDIREDMD